MKKLILSLFLISFVAVGCEKTIVSKSSENTIPSSTSSLSAVPANLEDLNQHPVQTNNSPAPINDQTNQQIKDLQKEINQLKKQQNSVPPVQNNPSPTTITPQVTTPSVPAQPNLQSIVSEWQNKVAIVICSFDDSTSLQGSALIGYMSTYGTTAITNAHVIVNANGRVPITCTVGNNLGSRLVGDVGGPQPYVSSKTFFASNGKIDSAYIKLSNTLSTPTDNGAFDAVGQGKVCNQNDVSLGDAILVLGYPSDGSRSSITATQGIVSGFDGNYIVTDAKIDHGNSGGAAILVKNDCYLGIPSAAVVGSIESYGRILKSNFVFGN